MILSYLQDGLRAEEFRSLIARAYRLRFLRVQMKIMFHSWRDYAMEFVNLRMQMVTEYRLNYFTRRRFLALRIVTTRERLLRLYYQYSVFSSDCPSTIR